MRVYYSLGLWLVGQRVGVEIKVVGGSIWGSVFLLVGSIYMVADRTNLNWL